MENSKSQKAGFVKKLIKSGTFDINKIKKPSKDLLKKFPLKKELTKQQIYDLKSGELQQLIYNTPIKQISDALQKMKYKGRIQTNKVMLNLQLLQNFKTVNKLDELIILLKKH